MSPPPEISGDASADTGAEAEALVATKPARRYGVLVVDTDQGVCWALEKGLTRSGYNVRTAQRVSEALRILNENGVDVIVVEYLPDAGLSLDAISQLIEKPQPPKLICASIDASPHTVMECMRRGAFDFLVKPFSLAEMRGAVGRAVERLKETRADEDEDAAAQAQGSALIGVSQATQDLRKTIQQAAHTNLNCLIRGQSGVGKDVVAREIHRLSKRHDKPFIKVNCSALPENLLESELFGYEKGAFTGADTSKPGRFSLANHGIIFLDEIGDMHPYVQAKILQVIEHKEFTKLGGGQPVKVDVQIIAATNADLEQKIASGQFRDDLFFRLNEVYIWVPPLAERREDIPLLVKHFLRQHGHYSGDKQLRLTAKELTALYEYDWPGNVRELESTIKRWLALGKASPIDLTRSHHAAAPVSAGASPPGLAAEPPGETKPPPTPDEVLEALEENQWNRRKVADLLGISYSALRRTIEKHKLDKRRLA